MIRLPRTALALGISLACAILFAGPASAQLVIESGPPPQPQPVIVPPPAVPPPAVQPPPVAAVPVQQLPAPAARAAPAPQPSWLPPRLTHPVPALASGWGKDVPFSLAVRQIVPQDWAVQSDSLGIVNDARVSWRGGAPWTQVLQDLADSQAVAVHEDWAAHSVSLSLPKANAQFHEPAPASGKISSAATSSVTFRAVAASQAPAHPAHPAHPEVEAGAAGRSIANAAVHTPVQAETAQPEPAQSAPPPPSWSLDPSMTLRQNVEAWGKRAGWHVVWNAADYRVVAPATFTGVFAAPSGPLAQLIQGYDTSEQPLIAKLTTMDHVVYVYDRHYTPAEVKPASAQQLAPEMFDIMGTTPHKQAPQADAVPSAAAPPLPPPDPQAVEAGSRLPPLVIGSSPSKH